MNRRTIAFLAVFIIVAATTAMAAAKIFDGYESLPWGTHLHKIMEAYPKGEMGEYNKEIVYTQDNPDPTIATRIFAFKDGQLTGVAVTFNGDYVKKTGLENLKQKFIQQYGQGKQTGGSTHMLSYVWEGKRTRISFVYVPDKPEMTVMQYEQKQQAKKRTKKG